MTEHRHIQELRHRSARHAPPQARYNPAFPLTRTARCGLCDGTYLCGSFSTGSSQRYAYYRRTNRACPSYGKSFRRADVEAASQDLLASLSFTPGFFAILKKGVGIVYDELRSERRSSFEHRTASREALQQKKRDYAEMMRTGKIDTTFGQELLADTDTELARLETTPTQRDAIGTNLLPILTHMEEILSNFGLLWRRLPIDRQKHFQEFVFPDGVRYDGNQFFGTSKTPYFFRLEVESGGDVSCLVNLLHLHWNNVTYAVAELLRISRDLSHNTVPIDPTIS